MDVLRAGAIKHRTNEHTSCWMVVEPRGEIHFDEGMYCNSRAGWLAGAGWLATNCLFKNSGAATKSRVESTTNSNSIRSIKTAH